MANPSGENEVSESRTSGGSLATADARGENREADRGGKAGRGKSSGGGGAPPGRRRGQFFEIYKPGQGYYTRMGTAIGAGILILAGGHFLFTRLEVIRNDQPWTLWVQVAIPFAVVVIMSLLSWWVVGTYRTTCDFFIATEGEMKKVSWSSRNELIGSTKVVIVFTLMLGVLLFMVDGAFAGFFRFIGVLRSGGGG